MSERRPAKHRTTRRPSARSTTTHDATDASTRDDPASGANTPVAAAPVPPRAPRGRALRTLYDTVLERPNVTGCFVGRKRRGGRDTGELALVCCVDQKVAADDLAIAHRVPGEMRWPQTSRRKATIRTDVIVARGTGVQAATLGPGDLATIDATAEVASVGVALRHPIYGDVLTTAGHAVLPRAGTIIEAPGDERSVTLQNMRLGAPRDALSARLLMAAWNADFDYALVRPVQGARCGNAYQDDLALGRHYVPDDADVRDAAPMFALTVRGLLSVTLHGIAGVFTVKGVRMEGLILTDLKTNDGDSGCVLVDARLRPVGLLTGFFLSSDERYALWTSLDRLLAREQARLI